MQLSSLTALLNSVQSVCASVCLGEFGCAQEAEKCKPRVHRDREGYAMGYIACKICVVADCAESFLLTAAISHKVKL